MAGMAKPALPYLPMLPTSVLSLPPTLALHLATHPSPSPLSYLSDPLAHPLHPPLLFMTLYIPVIYLLGVFSNNISWVDRSWPFLTPLCSTLVIVWVALNPSSSVYGHNVPRLALMLFLQYAWSTRLLAHATGRGFYDFKGEDYRYSQVKKMLPKWAFALLHILVVAIPQPLLLFALSLPMQAVLLLPPAELSPGPVPRLSLPYGAVKPFLPTRFDTASDSTPVLNLYDLLVVVLAFSLLYIEDKADKQMQAYQSAKHSPQAQKDMIHPTGPDSATKQAQPSVSSSEQEPLLSGPEQGWAIPGKPKAAPYSRQYHPGFPTKGLFGIVRHANFAAEQLFWFSQSLFVVAAGESSRATRSRWIGGSVFGPPLAVSNAV